jgi:peptide/nickel transport system ATP-binding protein
MSGFSQRLLQVTNLKKYFKAKQENLVFDFLGLNQRVHAVNGVTFWIPEGETLGLVGESGCGKTTVGRCIVRLTTPTAGEVRFRGEDVLSYSRRELKQYRQNVQMVFQDPQSSLNRRKTVGQIVGGPVTFHGLASGAEKRERVRELLQMVELPAAAYHKYPFELSGGQRQRVDIARALAVDPDLVVLDEPVSALDVSIQAQVLNLLMDLQDEHGFSYLFISHDLSVVQHIADRLAVMYLGELVETGATETVFADPRHPYTEILLDAIPNLDPHDRSREAEIYGELPDPIEPPDGCKFHTRCPKIIQPNDLDITEAQWRTVVQFRRLIQTNFAASSPDFGTKQEVIEAAETPEEFVHEKFGEVPQRCETALVRATELLRKDDRAAAADRLAETFESPCERREPTLESVNGHHEVQCHLHTSPELLDRSRRT